MRVSGGTEHRDHRLIKFTAALFFFHQLTGHQACMKISGADYEKINMEGRISESFIMTVKSCLPVDKA